ncbi:MAG: amino acid adenylation domain-containing protein, partial [bacterium]|nr:amino acid adenylation domain-containing protein [bacterium]
VQWQESGKQKEKMKRQEKVWLKQLSGELPELKLPTDNPRPPVRSFEGAKETFVIEKAETGRIKEIARENSATPYMVIQTIFTILLAKLSGQEDIIIGTPTAGRRHTQLENIIGMFVNTLALRNKPEGRKPILRYLEEVKTNTIQAFDNQEYPFEDLVERLSVRRETGRNPIFDVMFNHLSQPRKKEQDTIISAEPGASKTTGTTNTFAVKFDLSLNGNETGEHLQYQLEYSTKLFKKETIRRFITYFRGIMRTICSAPERTIAEIEIITEEEKKQILYEYNDTTTEYPHSKTIHQLFEEQAAKTPDSIGLVGSRQLESNTSTTSSPQHPVSSIQHPVSGIHLTYRQLNEKANRLARHLLTNGAAPGTVVALKVERSVAMVTGLLAILKTGAAYLPIAPDSPQERTNYILTDSNAGILLVDNKTENRENGAILLNLEHLEFDSESKVEIQPSDTFPGATGIAYILYTSGTMGRPKGVLVEHGNVTRLVMGTEEIELTPTDRLLLTGDYVFDITTYEIWGPLLKGAALYLAQKDKIMDAEKLETVIVKNKITLIHLIPQIFNQVAHQNPGVFAGLKRFLVGGDIVRPGEVNRVREQNKNLEIIHMYGPTENTTFSTYFPVQTNYEGRIPIGKPLANSTVYLLNKYGGLVPEGVPGEICVGGAGVARGYPNQPELTAERFVKASRQLAVGSSLSPLRPLSPFRPLSPLSPFPADPPEAPVTDGIYYRTGDQGRWLAGGNIEFLGRIDQQVKIRGYRIEPDEIKNQLLTHEKIKEAVVIVKEGQEGDKYLCAFIVAGEKTTGETGIEEELNAYLGDRLPAYMVPAYFVNLDSIPLTPNGKIDKRALKEFKIRGTGTQKEYTAPRSETENKLAAIWAGILEQEQSSMGIDDNFFRLGGHSLKAMILVSAIQKELEVKIPLPGVFKHPTIREMAGYIAGAAKEAAHKIERVGEKDYYPLSSAQKRIYMLYQMAPGSLNYNMPQAIPFEYGLEKKKVEEIIHGLIARHESLRTSFLMRDETPVQKIHGEEELTLEITDFGKVDSAHIDAMHKEARPFDLAKPPLLRVGIAATLRGDYLLWDMHHIVSDGLSVGILIKEFHHLYKGEELPELGLRYRDFAAWQNSGIYGAALREQEAYWLERFGGELPGLELPMDYRRPELQRFEGARLYFYLGEQETGALKEIAATREVTMFMLTAALYNILLSRLSGAE